MSLEEKYEKLNKEVFDKVLELSKSNQTEAKELLKTSILEIFNIKFEDLIEHLSNSTKQSCSSIAEDFIYIAPFGKYDLLLQDKSSKEEFIKTEAYKEKHWNFVKLVPEEEFAKFIFSNDAIEDMVGAVFINDNGKIKHSFAFNGE